MTPARQSAVLALLLLLPVAGWTETVSIGGTAIEIPNPPGFVAITPRMTAVYEFQKNFVAPTNQELLTFLPEGMVASAEKGEIPDFTRSFSVQTAKQIVDAPVPRSVFEEMKTLLKTRNEDIVSEIQKQVPEVMDSINQNLVESYAVDPALSVSQMIPLPAHHETDQIFAYSTLLKVAMNDESGNQVSSVTVATASFVYVKRKVLFLYCYAEQDGLEWSREISRTWSEAVVAANPSDVPSEERVSSWARIALGAVGGALIGMVVGILGWVILRRKPRRQE